MVTESKDNPPTGNSHIAIGAQINDHAAFLAGVSSEHFFTDADIFTQTQLLITEYYKLATFRLL